MAVDTTIQVKRITADADAALSGIKFIHAIVANTATLTSAASVLVGDVATSAAVSTTAIAIELHANTTHDGTNYEKTFGMVFPYPIRFTRAVSVDLTNCGSVYIYYS